MRIAIIVILAPLSCGLANGAVLAVDCEGGGDYESIQAAVTAAEAGDTLLIAPCVYREHVDASGKGLTFLGSGSDVTRLQWREDEPTLRVAETGTRATRVVDMTVAHITPGPAAVWSSRLYLDNCSVTGVLRGNGYLHPPVPAVSLCAANCEMQDIELEGGGGSHMTDCQFLTADIVGYFEYEYSGCQDVTMISCTGDAVRVGAVGVFRPDGSSFGAVQLDGGFHALPFMWAENSFLGHVVLTDYCDTIYLTACDLASLTFHADWDGSSDWFRVIGCTVRGPVLLDTYGLHARIVHNTILGDFEYLDTCSWWPFRLRSNIVTGATSIWANGRLVVSHNDLVGGVLLPAGGDSVTANISEAPLFCDEPEDLTLQDCSPCVGTAHDGTDIGAFPVGCECIVAVERVSWGAIKGLYR